MYRCTGGRSLKRKIGRKYFVLLFIIFVVLLIGRFMPDLLEKLTDNKEPDTFNRIIAEVVNVDSGDTFTVKIGSKEETVKLLFVEAPPYHEQNKGTYPYAAEAKQFLFKLLFNKKVELEANKNYTRTVEGTLLYHVFINGKSVQQTMIENSLVRVMDDRELTDKYINIYISAQEKVKEKREYIWKSPNYVTEFGYDFKAFPKYNPFEFQNF